MNKKLYSSLISSAGIYAIANVVNSSIPFLLLPVLTRVLSPSDYGLLSMIQVIVGLLTPFIGINLHGSISRKYYEQDKIDFPKYIGNCLYILLVTIIIVAVLLLFSSKQLSILFYVPQNWLWVAFVVTIGQFLLSILLVILQLQKKALLYGIFQVSQTVMNVTLTLLFVLMVGMSWRGSALGQAMAVVTFGAAGLYYLWKNNWILFSWNKEYLNQALRFGIFLIPHGLGAVIFSVTDRVLVANMISISDAGLYAVGYQIGMIVALLQNSFNQAWVPWLYERLKTNDYNAKKVIVKFIYYYGVAIIIVSLAIAWISPFLLQYYVGREFIGAKQFVLWIALGYAFNGMYKMVAAIIFYEEKTHILSIITICTAGFNIILNYTLIKINGAIGAAQASMITFLFSFLLTWFLAAKVHKMPWFLNNNVFPQKAERG